MCMHIMSQGFSLSTNFKDDFCMIGLVFIFLLISNDIHDIFDIMMHQLKAC